MKVKNIMFSGFAAAILMGVGAAHAVVANPVTLADQGYVDAKVGAARAHFDGKYDSTEKLTTLLNAKEDVANKATKAEVSTGLYDGEGNVVESALTTLGTNDTDFPTVAAAVEIANAKAQMVVTKVNAAAQDLTNLNNKVDGLVEKVNTTGTVADAIAGALTDAKAYADGLAGNYDAEGAAAQALVDAKAYADGLATNYETAGAAAQALTDAKAYADGLATNYDAAGTAAQALTDAKAYADGLATNYETAGAAAQALTDAKAYTDQEVGEVDVKVTANANAITTLNGDGDGSVKKMAADAATAAVNASGHAQKTYVDDELAKKLDKTAIDNAAGTYMVTSDGNGGFTYTKVKVATGVDSEGNATVTE